MRKSQIVNGGNGKGRVPVTGHHPARWADTQCLALLFLCATIAAAIGFGAPKGAKRRRRKARAISVPFAPPGFGSAA
jgi:hypothetical protein